jgi:hypothetical protein
MMRFNVVRLIGDDKVQISGPISAGDLVFAEHIAFAVAQEDVMLRGEDPNPGTDTWGVEVPASGLQPGPAFAFGVATLMPANEPGIQTFSWFEQVEVKR